MSPLSLALLISLAAAPAVQPVGTTAAKAEPTKTEPAPAAKPKTVEVKDPAPMAPEVRKAVDAMQKFYEDIKDFQAEFKQSYTYKTFGRKAESTGTMRFMKQGGSMRWDYAKPNVKVFVIANEKVYAYDEEAKQLVVSRLSADRLSASITFLWGQGKLDREFRITKAARTDLKDGFALELTPKIADPRFQKIFFLLDPKTFAVKTTVVVDPDGSENRMTFTNPKANSGFGNEAFKIEPPADVQVKRLDSP